MEGGRGGSLGATTGGAAGLGGRNSGGASGRGGDGSGEAGAAGEASGSGGASGSNAGVGGGGTAGVAGTGGMTARETIDEILARCPTEAELQSVDDDFALYFELTLVGDFVCHTSEGSRDLTRQEERAYQAFLAMRALTFDEPLPWTSLSLYDWFASSITGVHFYEVGGTCCGMGPNGGLEIGVTLGQGSSSLVTNLWANDAGHGLLALVDVMLHETRHSNDYWHTCPDGSSDRTYAEGGAWATVYDFHRWLAYHADPCFLRPIFPADPSYPRQLFGADAYQLASLKKADRTAEVRFCDAPPPYSDTVAEPLPICR